MHVLRQATEVQAFINETDDAELGQLLRRRVKEVEADGDRIEELARVIVIESGDSLSALEAHLEITLDVSGGYPSWEFIEDHGSTFEMVFVLSSSGYGAMVFVQKINGPSELLALCRQHAF